MKSFCWKSLGKIKKDSREKWKHSNGFRSVQLYFFTTIQSSKLLYDNKVFNINFNIKFKKECCASDPPLLHSTSKAFKELIELQLKIMQVITLISNQFKNLQINSRTKTNTIRAKKVKFCIRFSTMLWIVFIFRCILMT